MPSPAGPSSPSPPGRRKPVVVLVVGMAGTGKTSLMHALTAHLEAKGSPAYTLNLDPAVATVPYGSNLDVRDTVNYKEVMRQYNLGPNGAIVTALNLFATQCRAASRRFGPKPHPLDARRGTAAPNGRPSTRAEQALSTLETRAELTPSTLETSKKEAPRVRNAAPRRAPSKRRRNTHKGARKPPPGSRT